MSSTPCCSLFFIQCPAENLPVASLYIQSKIQTLYPLLCSLASFYLCGLYILSLSKPFFFFLKHAKLILISETLCLIFILPRMLFPPRFSRLTSLCKPLYSDVYFPSSGRPSTVYLSLRGCNLHKLFYPFHNYHPGTLMNGHPKNVIE